MYVLSWFLFVTVITLVIVPAAYMALEDFRGLVRKSGDFS
jgi:hypothetical protein